VKLPAATATSTIVPTAASAGIVSSIVSELLEHADNVNAAARAAATSALRRKTFIPISFV
jgi:NADP-dependent 3-hydroxy acid dehydrogenase YdfG